MNKKDDYGEIKDIPQEYLNVLKSGFSNVLGSVSVPASFLRLLLAIIFFLSLLIPVEWNSQVNLPIIAHLLFTGVMIPAYYFGGELGIDGISDFFLLIALVSAMFPFPILGGLNIVLFRKPSGLVTGIYWVLLIAFLVFAALSDITDMDLIANKAIIAFAIIVEMFIMVYTWWKRETVNESEPSDS